MVLLCLILVGAEADLPKPDTPYGQSKLATEKL